jgi:hypothetical protein
MYRERRELDGVSVPCFVCACGYAVPILKREPADAARVARLGRASAPRARVVSPPSAAERARTLAALDLDV